MIFEMDKSIAASLQLDPAPGVWPASIFGRQLAALISKLELDQKDVVDVGCGSGIQGIVAAKKGAKVAVSDISPEAVQCASSNGRKSGVSLEPRVGSGITIWAGRKFDVIICNGPTFEAIAETQEPLRAQRLRPLPMITLEIFKVRDQFLNEGGCIVGLVCGPYSGAVLRSAAADYDLHPELVLSLNYSGTLDGFGGTFTETVADATGFAERLSEGKVLIRATAYVLRRMNEVAPRR